MGPDDQSLAKNSLAKSSVGVLDWFALNGRRLPWRTTRDPWAVLVAELMLQQTQVSRVVDRWPRFLARFGDAAMCAASAPAEVIDEWAGLGYNRRALNLHRSAVAITDDHGGVFPVELADLLALPGIGPYTARAIRIFAFELDDAVLDTNVARILARLAGRPLGRAEAQRQADRAVPPGRGWDWNQAMLDVGARHCIARRPDCDGCPLSEACAWRAADHRGDDPAVGSAGVSGGQSRFEGSDRQGRGRLVTALRAGPVPHDRLAVVMGWPDEPERATRVAGRVVADGLAIVDGEHLALPR